MQENKESKKFTFWVEAIVQNVSDDLIRVVDRVFTPCLAVIRAQDDNFAFLSAERSEMRDFHDDWSQELGSDWSELQDAAGQSLALHQRWRVHGALRLNIAAGYARRLGGRASRDDDPHAAVTAPTHSTAARVHQERHQEAVISQKLSIMFNGISSCLRVRRLPKKKSALL